MLFGATNVLGTWSLFDLESALTTFEVRGFFFGCCCFASTQLTH